MKIVIQLYDDNAHGCGAFYRDVETIDELLQALDEVSFHGEYIYEIGKVEENETEDFNVQI